jgi:hypothetical protein
MFCNYSLILEKYEKKQNTVFDEFRNGFQKTLKISEYAKRDSVSNNPYWSLESFEDYYYFFEKSCKEKKITIKNPFTNKLMSTDIYFITSEGNYYGFPNLICNYCFIRENIILGISLGTAELGMFCGFLYLIDYNTNSILRFSHCDYPIYYSKYYTDYLFNMMNETIKNLNIDDIPIKIKTLYGLYTSSHSHNYFNDFTGIYVMNKMGFSIIDEVVIGPNDNLKIENILKEQYSNIHTIKVDNVFDYHNVVGRGVFFRYNHFYITNNCALYFKECLSKNFKLQLNTLSDIEYIKNNYRFIFSFHLRVGSCEMINQDIVISETINSLLTLHPKSFFIFDGFFGNENQNKILSLKGETYSELLEKYKKTVDSIIGKIHTTAYRSIIGECINTSIKYSEIVHFGIYMNTSSEIDLWTYNTPSMFFGRKNIDHSKNMYEVIRENAIPNNFFNDGITFFNENFSIESSTIVNKVINGLNNNFIF